MVYEEFPSIGDKVIIPVGDGMKKAFKVLSFDGTLALMESDKGEKICYRLNGKEKCFKNTQSQLPLFV